MMRITLRSSLWFLATVCLPIVSFWMVKADEPEAEKRTADDQKEAAEPRLTLDECKPLIEQLASKTPSPLTRDASPSLPRNISEGSLRTAQKPIREAFFKLSDNIEVALPLVVEHVKDNRFSYVYESVSGAYVAASVGTACGQLLRHHIEVYSPHVRSFGGSGIPGEPPYPRKPAFIADAGGAQKWWESRKDRKLSDLQIEAIEWAIQFEKKTGFSSPAQEKRIVSALEEQAASIRRASQPLLVKPELFFFSK